MDSELRIVTQVGGEVDNAASRRKAQTVLEPIKVATVQSFLVDNEIIATVPARAMAHVKNLVENVLRVVVEVGRPQLLLPPLLPIAPSAVLVGVLVDQAVLGPVGAAEVEQEAATVAGQL